jgi:plastocyanin
MMSRRNARPSRRTRRASLVVLVVALLTLGALTASAFAQPNRTVRTTGTISFQPNVHLNSNLQFSPGPLRAASGSSVTWQHHDRSGDPHTVTIVDAADLPQTLEDLFGPPPAAILDAFEGHFPNGAPVPVLDDGTAGLSGVGDSLLFFPGQTISAEVTAAPGETLSYICIFHPWMQGQITVTR